MRVFLTGLFLLISVSAFGFTLNGKTISTWNGKTLATWNGKTASTAAPDLTDFESGTNSFAYYYDTGQTPLVTAPIDGGRSTTQAHGGSYSYKVTTGAWDDGVSGGSLYAGVHKTITTGAGTLSAWFYADANTNAQLMNGTTVLATKTGNGAWQQITATITAGSKTIGVTAIDHLNFESPVRVCYIDDISIPQ